MFEFEKGYYITENGEVYSRKRNKMLKHSINSNGYPFVSVFVNGKQKPRMIHRLLAIAYIPNPKNKPVVNHIDGNKKNFSLENLEWATYSENTQNAINRGTYCLPKNQPKPKRTMVYYGDDIYPKLMKKLSENNLTFKEWIKNQIKEYVGDIQ